MIGDNPRNDHQGATAFERGYGTKWLSLLVETGVHRAGDKPSYEPTWTAPDVMAAVRKIMAE